MNKCQGSFFIGYMCGRRNNMRKINEQRNDNKHTCYVGRYCTETSYIPPQDATVGTHLCRFSETRNVARSALKANIAETR